MSKDNVRVNATIRGHVTTIIVDDRCWLADLRTHLCVLGKCLPEELTTVEVLERTDEPASRIATGYERLGEDEERFGESDGPSH